MNQGDIQKLGKRLAVIRASMDKGPLPLEALEDWVRLLENIPWEMVDRAIDEHRKISPYAPQPSDILTAIRSVDGYPGPEEAWTLGKIATDQWNSVVLTNEIDDAALAAQDEMTGGNEIAARQIFKEVYVRLVAEARAKGKPVNWFLSEGWDKQKRVPAIREALERGLISPKQASRKLPHDAQYALPPAMSKVVKLIGDGKRMNVSDEERSNALTALKKEIAAQRKRGC